MAELASSGTCTRRNSNPALHASIWIFARLFCTLYVPLGYTAPTAIANANANTNTCTLPARQASDSGTGSATSWLPKFQSAISQTGSRACNSLSPLRHDGASPPRHARSRTTRTTRTTSYPWKNPRRLADASLILPPSMHAMGRQSSSCHDMTPARANGPPGRLSQAKLASWDSTMEKLLKIPPRRSRRALPALKHTAKLALPPASPSNLP